MAHVVRRRAGAPGRILCTRQAGTPSEHMLSERVFPEGRLQSLVCHVCLFELSPKRCVHGHWPWYCPFARPEAYEGNELQRFVTQAACNAR